MKFLLVAALAAVAVAQLDPEIICAQQCPSIYTPVCGSDGQTYSNECTFATAQCVAAIRSQSDSSVVQLTFRSMGECGGNNNPDVPDFPEIPNTDCGDCSMQWAPVCGSNGVTYGNGCLLRQANCLAQGWEIISLMYPGECEDDETDPEGCPEICPDIWRPVCVIEGASEVTYPNQCAVDMANCGRSFDQQLTVMYEGNCLELGNGGDGDSAAELCANACEESEIAGENACEFQKQSCLNFGSPMMCQTSFEQCIGVVEEAKAMCLGPCDALRDIDFPNLPGFP